MVGQIEDLSADGESQGLLGRLRLACAAVAERAGHVRINGDAIEAYATSLSAVTGHPAAPRGAVTGHPAAPLGAVNGHPATPLGAVTDQPAAPLGAVNGDSVPPLVTESPFTSDEAPFWVTLDAINFGSGWFPTLRKPPGKSGYFTIATALRERFEQAGPWPADELAEITASEIAEVLGQDPDHQLMALFARSLNDLGRHVRADHAGSFEALVASARGSAVRLVDQLATWECFGDTSPYQELRLPFLKRAQIAAADLHRSGAARFDDLDRLTIFADNLVPHVLRLDGVLTFAPSLTRRIERGEPIEHDSPEEVEIRACALHAVELIVAARPELTAVQVDELLWNRGQQPHYKAKPRHRSRCTTY